MIVLAVPATAGESAFQSTANVARGKGPKVRTRLGFMAVSASAIPD
jgi:hypothetical protein